MSEDFPEPLPPSNPWIRPRKTRKLTSRNACVAPKVFDKDRIFNAASLVSTASEPATGRSHDGWKAQAARCGLDFNFELLSVPDLQIRRLEVERGHKDLTFGRKIMIFVDILETGPLIRHIFRILPGQDAVDVISLGHPDPAQRKGD